MCLDGKTDVKAAAGESMLLTRAQNVPSGLTENKTNALPKGKL